VGAIAVPAALATAPTVATPAGAFAEVDVLTVAPGATALMIATPLVAVLAVLAGPAARLTVAAVTAGLTDGDGAFATLDTTATAAADVSCVAG
jgi:hypothetical protein